MSNESANSPPQASLLELARQAAGIARNSHLQSINMRSLHVDLLSDPSAEAREVALENQHRVEHFFTPETTESPAFLRVRIHFNLLVRDVERAEELFRLGVVFDAEYALNRNMPPGVAESLNAFSATNAVLNVWPYYREVVQSTTWRMGLPPFPLPLFRITDSTSER